MTSENMKCHINEHTTSLSVDFNNSVDIKKLFHRLWFIYVYNVTKIALKLVDTYINNTFFIFQ